MGFYSKHVLPRLINFAMRNKESARLRAEWIPQARGDVLEIGVGSGLNLPFYSPEVKHIYGVDPSVELQRMARERAAREAVKIDFILQGADEPLALADESMDTIVMTWTLCSIANPAEALRHMKRVLKPAGNLVFIEHGRSPDAGVAKWQDRFTPAWKKIGGGCHLNRKADDLISSAGFQITELRNFYLPGPRAATYTYQGVARRAG